MLDRVNANFQQTPAISTCILNTFAGSLLDVCWIVQTPYNMLGMENAAFCDFRLRHILRVNCAEMAGDGPAQPAYQIFSIKRTFLA